MCIEWDVTHSVTRLILRSLVDWLDSVYGLPKSPSKPDIHRRTGWEGYYRCLQYARVSDWHCKQFLVGEGASRVQVICSLSVRRI